MNIKYYTFLLIFFISSNLFSQSKPSKGYIQDIEIDYSSPNIVYAATLGQGLFKSINYGKKWELIIDTTKYKEINVIKIFPDNPNKIIIGGEKTGLLYSSNKGKTWGQIGLEGSTICDISIDPKKPNRVFVLAEEGVYYNDDIFKDDWILSFNYRKYVDSFSQDKKLYPYWYYTRFQRIAINPHNTNTIFLAGRWEGGYYRSDNGGKTWEHKSVSGIYRRVDVIHFHPIDSQIVYLGTHHQGLFASYNGGESFVPHSDGIKPQIRSPYYGAYLISGFTIDPTNPKIFYTGSDYSNWKTTDGGHNWFEIDKSLTCEFVRVMAVDPKNPNIIYAGSNIGIYKSTDKGTSWEAINDGLKNVELIKKIDVRINNNKYSFALSKEYPFVFRKSKGKSWKSFSWLLAENGAKEGKDIYYDEKDKKLVLITDNGEYVSFDEGYRWIGKGSERNFVDIKSEANQIDEVQNIEKDSFRLNVYLKGNVFLNDNYVDFYYKKPPYISIQLLEEGYPYNKTKTLWTKNIKDSLNFPIDIPRNMLSNNRTYILYVEVRDFQKNYKTGFVKLNFDNVQVKDIEIYLEEGFCLKK